MEGVIALGLSTLRKAVPAQKPKPNEHFEVANKLQSLNDSINPITVDKLKSENIYSKLQNIKTDGATSWDRISAIFFIMVWVMLGVYCAYLSWTSNTLIKWDVHYKVLFAFGAFMFPIYYLLMYYIGKYSLIRYIQTRKCR